MKPKLKQSVLIFTGGHHTSGLAVATNLIDKGYKVIWFGHRHAAWKDDSDSAEYKEVTAKGIEFINLHAGKFYRTFNPLKLFRIPWGFFQSLYYLIKYQHQYQILGIVSFGGYLAVPVVLAGWLLGIPSLTHEQTLVAGYANRVISHFCRKIAISWPSSSIYYPFNKTVFVGLPLRNELLNAHHKIKKHQIYVTGGKQGSHIINQAIFSALPELSKNFSIIHQTGSNTQFRDLEKASSYNYENYLAVDYVDAQTHTKYLAESEIIISRAGAHIISELLFLQKKSVLIPISWGSHNEQIINAKQLVSNNLAVLLLEKNLSTESLIKSIHQAYNLQPKLNKYQFNGLSNFAKLIVNEFT